MRQCPVFNEAGEKHFALAPKRHRKNILIPIDDPNANPVPLGKFRRLAAIYIPKAISFVVMAMLLGYAADFAARRNDPSRPAGFIWGFVHGALMPTTLPALFLGKDVTIYAPHNSGRTYKLGYTMGVNGCGLVFFGILFWTPKRRDESVDQKSKPL